MSIITAESVSLRATIAARRAALDVILRRARRLRPPLPMSLPGANPPEHEVTATQPNRSNVYSIRLSEEERARVRQVADAKHLPASTLVRSWILDRINQEETA